MAKPLRIHQIKRIIEFDNQGRSIREMARLTSLSRNKVRDYLRRFHNSGMNHEQILGMDEESLASLFYVESTERQLAGRNTDHDRFARLEPLLQELCRELGKRGVTRQLLWEEYRKENPQGYGYTQFCAYLKEHLNRDEAVMHLTHVPGEQLQVDFAGGKLGYVDRCTGEWISCEVLVCCMPYSHYIYAQALRSQRQEEFINGLIMPLNIFKAFRSALNVTILFT